MSLIQKMFEDATFAKKTVVKTATGNVGLYENSILCSAAVSPGITLTLPAVAEAAGQSYFFTCGTTTYPVRIVNKGDSRRWRSAIVLDQAEEWVELRSSGTDWRVYKTSGLRKTYTYEDFKVQPVVSKILGGASGGTAGNVNAMIFGGADKTNVFEYCILGTQTITGPCLEATGARGLDMTLDETNADDGWEMTNGILSRGNSDILIGRDGGYFKVNFYLEDVSGTDDCAVGFRKAEAYQANIDDYADMACLNVISGTITIETIVGGAATTSTSTTNTWADLATKTLEVYVSTAGVVTYKITGVAPTVTAAFTFTAGLSVVPFMYFLQNTDLTKIHINSWECGLL
jgi:hypothetical protein